MKFDISVQRYGKFLIYANFRAKKKENPPLYERGGIGAKLAGSLREGCRQDWRIDCRNDIPTKWTLLILQAGN